MAGSAARERGTGLVASGVGLVVLGVVWTLWGARSAVLEVCSPPSSSCEAALRARLVVEDFYGPNGACIVAGAVLVVIGVVLIRRTRHAPAE